MNRKDTIELLTSDPSAVVEFSSQPGRGFPYDFHRVWLDSGELVYSHPTDPRRGSISVPGHVDKFAVVSGCDEFGPL